MSPDRVDVLDALDRLLAEASPADLPAFSAALAARQSAVAARLLERDRDPHGVTAQAPDENLGVEEAARRLGVSRDWLYRNHRRLPFTVRINRRLLFSAHGLERWNRRRQGS